MNNSDLNKNPEENKKVSTSVIIGVVMALVLGVVAYYVVNNKSQNVNQPNVSNIQQESVNNQNGDSEKMITLDEISNHNSKENCWTAIDNSVYDLTSFVSKHKGGDKILAVCGIDGSKLFSGEDPMGRMHGEMAKMVLSGMKIGTLQN